MPWKQGPNGPERWGETKLMLEGNIKAGQRLALSVLLVDEDRSLLLEQAALLESMGHECRLAGNADEAQRIFAAETDISLVVVDADIAGRSGMQLIRTLSEYNQIGRNFLAILLTSNPSLELAVQAMQQGVIDFLSKPFSADQFAAAIERASLRLFASAANASRETEVSSSFAAIQSSISMLMEKLGVSTKDQGPSEDDMASSMTNPNAIHPSALKAIIKARRNRQKYFEGDLFSDPSWDILLELTAAHIENRQESVTSVAISASVPASTAIRKIRELAERDLVRRWTDPNDARRIFVALTDDAAKRMLAVLAAAEKAPII